MAEAAPGLVDLKVHPQGALELIHDGATDGDRYVVHDAFGAAYEIDAVREVFGRDVGLGLLEAADGAVPPWRLREGGESLALDLDPAWLGEAESWIVPASATRDGPVSVVHSDPVTGGRTPVEPGRRYACRFTAQGGHVVPQVLIHDAEGRALPPLTGAARAIAAYSGEVKLDFEAPAGAAELEISVAVEASGQAVRLGRPELVQVDAGAPDFVETLHLPRRVLDRLRAQGSRGDLARVRLPLPGRWLDGEAHRLEVAVQSATGAAVAETVFRFAPRVQLARQGIERASLVRLVGRLADPAERYVGLQVWVDGRPGPVRRVKAAANGKFDARLPIPDAHLDGQLHRIEVREAASQAVLFAANERTAGFLARWPVLQQWAQPPLSPESAPAARRHLKALSAWAERAARGEPIPPVNTLHQELLGGVRKRTAYPPRAFPELAAPRVSVVMPAHDKFEVTYAGLCALLFAPNEVDFEVIVVDDGSSDETRRAEEIVSGVRVVRHEAAQGFVAACNDGAAAARGELIVFLNNDTEVTAGWLDELAGGFERFPDVGLTGAKLIYPDGRLQEAGGIVWGTGDPWNAGRGGDPDHPMWNYPREADYLSGAAIMIRRSTWDEVGGFGPEWAPAYFEDTDLAFKVRASGRRVVYVPTAEVYHFEGQTAGTDKAEGTKRFQEVNRPKFKEKWKAMYAGHGAVVGERPDLEKDRTALRVLAVIAGYPEAEIPQAFFDLLRDLQGLGCKVTLLPLDLTWRPTADALSRMGVECLSAPWVKDPFEHLRATAADVDAVLAGADVDQARLRRVVGETAPVIALVGDEPLAAALAKAGIEGSPRGGLRYLPDTPPAP